MFPIEQKYFPCLKVIKQPCARVAYRAIDETEIEITEIGFHPMILIYMSNHAGFISELEQATEAHYKDEFGDKANAVRAVEHLRKNTSK